MSKRATGRCARGTLYCFRDAEQLDRGRAKAAECDGDAAGAYRMEVLDTEASAARFPWLGRAIVYVLIFDTVLIFLI